jgi:hypothetical protein
MSVTLRRTIPLILISATITLITLQYFLQIDLLTNIKDELVRWGTIGTAMAVLYGISVEVVRNIRLASRQREIKDIVYYSMYFLFMIIFIVTGMLYGVQSDAFVNLYVRILAPSTFAIELVYGLMLVSAGYRTMRASSLPATVLAISALLILLRNSPMMTTFFPPLAPIADWLNIPLTGGSRGALIGAGIGALMISLRAIAMKEGGLVEAGE